MQGNGGAMQEEHEVDELESDSESSEAVHDESENGTNSVSFNVHLPLLMNLYSTSAT